MSTTNSSENWRYNSGIILYSFNGFLSYSTIMLNIVAIHTLRKTSSLPTTLKILLLSLAFSDLGVGLLVQPLRIAGSAMGLLKHEGESAIVYTAYKILMNLFYYPSFFGVMALAADRFLAIQLHLRYQELVTHKRVVTVVISIWALSIFLSLLIFWISLQKVRLIIYTTVEVFCLVATASLYFKIYLVVRRHTKQMQALQVRQQGGKNNETLQSVARRKKSAVATFYVYLVFLACFVPQNCLQIAAFSAGSQNTLYDDFSIYTLTLVFLNSSLNPLIYCWKMKQIRQTVMNVLRNVHASHN